MSVENVTGDPGSVKGYPKPNKETEDDDPTGKLIHQLEEWRHKRYMQGWNDGYRAGKSVPRPEVK